MRRHMANSGSGSRSAASQPPSNSTVPPPMPAHMVQPFPFGPGPDLVYRPSAGYHFVQAGVPGSIISHDPAGQGGLIHPFLLQPARPGGYHDYLRIIEQRRTVAENNRGASKSCIERNTFPHKFTKIQREKNEDGEEDVEKCTICLCGKTSLSNCLETLHCKMFFCVKYIL